MVFVEAGGDVDSVYDETTSEIVSYKNNLSVRPL